MGSFAFGYISLSPLKTGAQGRLHSKRLLSSSTPSPIPHEVPRHRTRVCRVAELWDLVVPRSFSRHPLSPKS